MSALPVLAGSALSAVGVVAAAAGDIGFDPASLVGAVVTPAIVVYLLLRGKLHTEGDYQRVVADRDAEKVERQRVQTALEGVIPALTRTTIVMEAIMPLLQSEVQARIAARVAQEGG